MVDTQLGRNAIRHAGKHSALASGASMHGALVPLLIAARLPGPGWIATQCLMIGGVTVTAIGGPVS